MQGTQFMVGGYLLIDGEPQKIVSIAGDSILLEGETRWMGRAQAERFTYSGPQHTDTTSSRQAGKMEGVGQMGKLRF